MEAERLIELLEDAGCEVRSYSGRGMYGMECVGFTVGEPGAVLGIVADIVAEVEDEDKLEVARLFRASHTDSMGTGTVIYFPRMKWGGK